MMMKPMPAPCGITPVRHSVTRNPHHLVRSSMVEKLARTNSRWQQTVHTLMRKGFGWEDIAVKLKCDPEHIKDEFDILRLEGRLAEIYRAGRS